MNNIRFDNTLAQVSSIMMVEMYQFDETMEFLEYFKSKIIRAQELKDKMIATGTKDFSAEAIMDFCEREERKSKLRLVEDE